MAHRDMPPANKDSADHAAIHLESAQRIHAAAPKQPEFRELLKWGEYDTGNHRVPDAAPWLTCQRRLLSPTAHLPDHMHNPPCRPKRMD